MKFQSSKAIYSLLLLYALSTAGIFTTIDGKAEPSAENLLKPIMQKIGPIFGALGKQINNPQMIASSTQLCQELFSLFQSTILILPAKVEALTEPEKTIRKVEYQALILNLMLELNHLEKILIDDSRDPQFRTKEAVEIFLRVNDLRKSGHQLFQ